MKHLFVGILWAGGSLSLAIGLFTTVKILGDTGLNVFSRRTVFIALSSLGLGLAGFAVFGYVGSFANPSLAQTMRLMVVVGPMVGMSVLRGMVAIWRASAWEAYRSGRPTWPGIAEADLVAWAKRKGHLDA